MTAQYNRFQCLEIYLNIQRKFSYPYFHPVTAIKNSTYITTHDIVCNKIIQLRKNVS